MSDITTCPVCLEPLSDAASRKATFTSSCGHIMHTECMLENALRGNINCPLCRTCCATVPEEMARANQMLAVSEHDEKTLTSMFRKASRAMQKGTASAETVAAMKKYTTYVAAMEARKADEAKAAPELLNFRRTITSLVKDEKDKCARRIEALVGSSNKARRLSSMKVNFTPMKSPMVEREKRRKKTLKIAVASTVGWRPSNII